MFVVTYLELICTNGEWSWDEGTCLYVTKDEAVDFMKCLYKDGGYKCIRLWEAKELEYHYDIRVDINLNE